MSGLALLLVLLLAGGIARGEGRKPEKQPVKSASHPVRDLKEGANEALNDIDRGIHKALPAMKSGAEKALEAVDRGVHKVIAPKKK